MKIFQRRLHPQVHKQNQPPTEKRKSYSVAIVIQQTTFQGMERVIKYVDAQSNMTSIIDNVNECAQYLIKEIELLLTNSYIDNEIIILTF